MKVKIGAVIEARMNSHRFPRKVMKEIAGKPLLQMLIERLKKSEKLNKIIIATTANKQDNVIEQLAKKLNIDCFRGSEDDVLDRVINAAKFNKIDIIVELMGDSPLLDSELIDEMINFYLNNNYDYVTNHQMIHSKKWEEQPTFLKGIVVQIFSTEILDKVAKTTSEPYDKENVTPFIYEHPELFKLGAFHAQGKFASYKYPELSLHTNYPKEFELIKLIFESIYPKNPDFKVPDVINFLKNNPELIKEFNLKL